MTGVLWALLGILGGVAFTVLGDMISEEIRTRLDHLPHAILRLAAMRLTHVQRIMFYENQWLPELCYLLRGKESRPISRLFTGVRFSLSLVRIAHRIPRPHSVELGDLLHRDALNLILHDGGIVKRVDELWSKMRSDAMARPLTSDASCILVHRAGYQPFAITPEQLRKLYMEEPIAVIDLDSDRWLPMTLKQLNEITTTLTSSDGPPSCFTTGLIKKLSDDIGTAS